MTSKETTIKARRYIALLTASVVSTMTIAAQTPAISIPDGAISLLVVGDWGRQGEHGQRDVAAVMGRVAESIDAAVVVSVGDNFYPNGVESVRDPQWQSSFENIYTAHSLHIPWIVATGNHDYHGSVQAQIDYSSVSRRWHMPGRYFDTTLVEEHDGDTVSVLLLVIDTSPFQVRYRNSGTLEYTDIDKQDTAVQRRMIDSVLRSSKATWKVVIGHHPMYSGGKRKGMTQDMITAFHRSFADHGVHAYIAGHEHDLQHHDDGSGVQYFVSGAGSQVRPVGPMEHTKFAKSVSGFATMVASSSQLQVHFVDLNGTLLYSTAIRRR